jgi:pimeloyl-ACP methyl ester carboxylesterase
VPELNVPVFFMEGRSDWESPYEVAERYFDAIKAPSKELIWFDRSAHLPNSEERDLFNQVMVAKVLPVACRGLSARSWRAHRKGLRKARILAWI